MKLLPRLFRAACATLLLACAALVHASEAFYLKDGDRVVFYGDSITDQRLYTTFTETFVVTRFPKLRVDFVHSGWGGDRVGGGAGGNIDTRLNRDVFAYDPTVVTVMLGMNDGSYRAFDQNIFNTYTKGLEDIVQKVRAAKPDVRLTLIQPSPYDDVTREPRFPGGYNAVLVRYGEAVKEIATRHSLHVADLNTPVVAMLEKAKAADAELSTRIIADRVHPAPAGHLIMAAALLKSWNAPAIVSAVEIDAALARPGRTINAQVDKLQVTPALITWEQLDGSLPMPVATNDAALALAVKSSDFVESLNRQLLRVTGLSAAGYELFIDDRLIANFSPAELAAGVNLTAFATPMMDQAAEVHKLTLQRAGIHQTRWRSFQVPYANGPETVRAELPVIMNALDEADRSAARMQRAMSAPISHRFRLVAYTAEQLAARGEPIEHIPADFGANLALDKPWTTSAPNTYGWNRGLTDGSWESRHGATFATNDAATFPKTVTVDLGATMEIGRIVTGVPSFGSTKTVAVSISADGETFRQVGRYVFSLNKAEKRLFNFAPTSARYVRLTYLDHHAERANYTPTFAFTTDLQIFAPAKR
jgi:Lysophospholipase L1 and related esterases